MKVSELKEATQGLKKMTAWAVYPILIRVPGFCLADMITNLEHDEGFTIYEKPEEIKGAGRYIPRYPETEVPAFTDFPGVTIVKPVVSEEREVTAQDKSAVWCQGGRVRTEDTGRLGTMSIGEYLRIKETTKSWTEQGMEVEEMIDKIFDRVYVYNVLPGLTSSLRPSIAVVYADEPLIASRILRGQFDGTAVDASANDQNFAQGQVNIIPFTRGPIGSRRNDLHFNGVHGHPGTAAIIVVPGELYGHVPSTNRNKGVNWFSHSDGTWSFKHSDAPVFTKTKPGDLITYVMDAVKKSADRASKKKFAVVHGRNWENRLDTKIGPFIKRLEEELNKLGKNPLVHKRLAVLSNLTGIRHALGFKSVISSELAALAVENWELAVPRIRVLLKSATKRTADIRAKIEDSRK